MKKILLIILLLFFSAITEAQTWTTMPIRTKAQQTAGLSGGEGMQMVFGISYAPSNPNIVYFVNDASQVWKSTDGGTSWQRKAVGFGAVGGLSLAVDPTNANIVYVAGSVMGTWADLPGTVEGIFRTADGGDTWTLVKQAHFHRAYSGGIHFSFAGSAIYAGPSTGGVLKSTNGGTTWTLLAKSGGGLVLDTASILDMKAHPTDSTILFICSSSGLHKIVDSGGFATVTKIGNGLPTNPYNVQIDTNNPDIMYASARTYGVYRSTDGGLNFSARNNGLSTPLSSGGEVQYMAMSPVNTNKLLISFRNLFGKYLYYTNNGGANWYQTSSMDEQNADGWICGSTFGYGFGSGIDTSRSPISFHPTDENIALVNGWGNQIKKTIDGGVNWRYSNTGYVGGGAGQSSSVTAITWDSDNTNKFCLFLEDFGPKLTINNGDTFSHLSVPAFNGRAETFSGAMKGDIIVTATGPDSGNMRIAISRNSGSSWTQVAGADAIFYFIAFHPQNANVVYAEQYKFGSIQTSNSFTTLQRPVKAIFKANGNIVYSYSGSIIYKSTDGGSTWINPYPSLNLPSGYAVRQIAVDPNDQNRIYAAVTGKGIYIITNTVANGGTVLLKNEAHGLAKDQTGAVNVNSVAIDPNNSNIIYAGTRVAWIAMSNGVFRSTDQGNTWININGNLGTHFNILGININPNTSDIYLGSYIGTWKLPPPSGDPGTGTGGAPLVVTGTATDIMQASATLKATINPNGSSTTARWQYGTQSENYTLVTGSVTVGNGTSSVDVGTSAASLSAGITYYVRCQANNANGNTNGSETSFTTSAPTLSYSAIQTGTNSIILDGTLSEWPPLTNGISKTIVGTCTATGTWSARWTPSGLYVAVSITDATPYGDTGSSTPWQDDSVELYIQRDAGKPTTYNALTRHFVNAYNSSFIQSENASGGTNTGVFVARKSTVAGYDQEWYIPVTNFIAGSSSLSAGTRLGFDVQLNDDTNGEDREGAKDWENDPPDTNYFNPSGFGELLLLGTTTETSASSIEIIPFCLGWWKLDNNANDSSPSLLHGTPTGITYQEGKLGNSGYFDGIDDYVTIPLINNDEVSISAWFFRDTAGSNDVIFGGLKWDADVQLQENFDLVFYSGSHNLQFVLITKNSSGTRTTQTASYTFASSIGGWHHAVGTYNKNTGEQKLYVDGNLANTQLHPAGNTVVPLTDRSYLSIGCRYTNYGFFDGAIDDVRYYSKPLSSQDVLDLTTIGSVTVTVGSPTSITNTSAILKGTITPNGSSTFNAYFRYGTSSTVYTGTTTEQLIGTGSTPVALSRTISSLSPNTTYYLAPVAYNTAGIHVLGPETSFTTLGVDSTAPVGTITVNSGATYTNSTAITLSLSATDAIGVEGYFLSTGTETPISTQEGWISVATSTSYSENIHYVLAVGDDTKTVYGWYKDGVGNISNIASDSIVLDTVFTSVNISSPQSNCTIGTSTKAYGTTASIIAMSGSSTDTNNVSTVIMRNRGTTTVATVTGTESFSFSASLASNSINYIDVTGQDFAGNQGTDTLVLGAFPTVSTTDATSITRNSVQFNGTCSANNNTTTVWYDYGLYSGDYTGSSSTQQVTGSVDTVINISLGALNRNTEYFYRLSGSNTVGITHGGEFSFTTLPGYTSQEVTGTRQEDMTTNHIFSTKFRQGLRLYGILLEKRWKSTADIQRLKNDTDNEITLAIEAQ